MTVSPPELATQRLGRLYILSCWPAAATGSPADQVHGALRAEEAASSVVLVTHDKPNASRSPVRW